MHWTKLCSLLQKRVGKTAPSGKLKPLYRQAHCKKNDLQLLWTTNTLLPSLKQQFLLAYIWAPHGVYLNCSLLVFWEWGRKRSHLLAPFDMGWRYFEQSTLIGPSSSSMSVFPIPFLSPSGFRIQGTGRHRTLCPFTTHPLSLHKASELAQATRNCKREPCLISNGLSCEVSLARSPMLPVSALEKQIP